MCIKDEQAEKIIDFYELWPLKLPSMTRQDFIDEVACDVAGGMCDFGPEDMKDPENIKEIVMNLIQAVSGNITVAHTPAGAGFNNDLRDPAYMTAVMNRCKELLEPTLMSIE